MARLSAVVRQRAEWLDRPAEEIPIERLSAWQREVQLWAMTGDRALVPALRPALRDTRELRERGLVGLATLLPLPPLRACDVALDAILKVLDGDARAAYPAHLLEPCQDPRSDDLEECWIRLRDRMIAALEARLAQDPPATEERRR